MDIYKPIGSVEAMKTPPIAVLAGLVRYPVLTHLAHVSSAKGRLFFDEIEQPPVGPILSRSGPLQDLKLDFRATLLILISS